MPRRHCGDDTVAAATCVSLKRIAARFRELDVEIAAHSVDLTRCVAEANPAILQVNGIGVVTAAQLLATGGATPSASSPRSRSR